MSNNNDKTVRLNVGGHPFEVPKSLFELYTESMLAKLVDEKWNKSDNEDVNKPPIFIDRDGESFRYVLRLMRERTVVLPITESHDAFLSDLEYFNLEDTKDTPLDIQYGTLQEAAKLLQVVQGNVDEQLKMRDDAIRKNKAEIEEWENEKKAIKTAQNLFKRSSNSERTTTNDKPEWEQTTVKFDHHSHDGSVAQQAYDDAKASLEVKDFLGHRLEEYGLVLVETSAKVYTYCKFLLERRIQKKANNEDEAAIDDKKKSPPPPPLASRKSTRKRKQAN